MVLLLLLLLMVVVVLLWWGRLDADGGRRKIPGAGAGGVVVLAGSAGLLLAGTAKVGVRGRRGRGRRDGRRAGDRDRRRRVVVLGGGPHAGISGLVCVMMIHCIRGCMLGPSLVDRGCGIRGMPVMVALG